MHMGLAVVPGAGAAGRRRSWKPFCLREACVARAQEQIVAGRVQRAGDPRGRGGLLGVKGGVGTRHGLQMPSLGVAGTAGQRAMTVQTERELAAKERALTYPGSAGTWGTWGTWICLVLLLSRLRICVSERFGCKCNPSIALT